MKQYDSKTQRRSLYQTQQELSSRSSESHIQVRDHICKVDTEIEPPLDKTPVGISDDGSSIELLAHVQKIKTLLRHKLDLLDNSNKSLDSTSSDMCHQAIMNADTNLLTSCPSHRQCFLSTASSSQDVKRCAAITEFLCDVEKCRCCQELIALKGIMCRGRLIIHIRNSYSVLSEIYSDLLGLFKLITLMISLMKLTWVELRPGCKIAHGYIISPV